MKNRNAAVRPNTPKIGFVSDTIAELKKVVWLSRQEIFYLTALVLIVTVSVGLVLGIIDYGFSILVDSVFIPK